ncbi:MAG: hypothetical protein ACYDCO_06395 [Armatimonadota bacterium]
MMDIHVTIDFFDDLYRGQAGWTEERLRALVGGLTERGVSVIHWLDYGGINEGGWDAGSYFNPDGKGQRFIRVVPDPLAVVCDEAHRRGASVCSVLKIRDLALGMPFASYPLGAGPQLPVGMPHLGGVGSWALHWLREHPEVRYRLHPSLIPEDSGQAIRTIRLWHESATPPESIPVLDLWVSEDNGTYRRYDGPMHVTQEVRHRRAPRFAPAPQQCFDESRPAFCIELSDLDIRQPFLCISPCQPFELANTLTALVEVEDAGGRPVAVTYGLTAYQPYGQAGHDWRQAGIAFDAGRRTRLPVRVHPYSAGRARLSLADALMGSPNKQIAPGSQGDDEYVILGLARGRNIHLTGLVDLAHTVARDWLHGIVRKALDAGVDAVDIRPSSHTETLDWENYGFSEPAMAEFFRRYGVDVASQPFDRQAWQALQGEYYDTFMQETARIVHDRGVPLYAHLLPVMDGMPEWPDGLAFQNQRWNWRRWLEDGWVDGITLKGCPLGSDMFVEAVALSRRLGITSILNNKVGGADREAAWLEQISQAEAAGLDSVNLYECAQIVRLQADGRLDFAYPRLWERVGAAPRQ